MKVVLINPNSTVTMTEAAVAAARRAAPEVDFAGWTCHDGPPAIQSAADGEAAMGPLLRLVERAVADGVDGIVIACFDDTGLAEARALAPCPVIGIGQAAFALASLIGDRFAVITTTEGSLPVIEANIVAGGFGPALVHLGAADVPVLDLEADPEGSAERIVARLDTAMRAGPDALVLGCAGMTGVIDRIRRRCPVPVIEGVTAAALLIPAAIAAARTLPAAATVADPVPL